MKKALALTFIFAFFSLLIGQWFNFTPLRKISSVSPPGSCVDNLNRFVDPIQQRITRVQNFKRPIILATDTSLEMSNGVVTVIKNMTNEMDAMGIEYKFISPQDAPSFLPPNGITQGTALTYLSHNHLKEIIDDTNPLAIHLVTEGTIGQTVKQFANDNNIPFSTFYHTAWPEFFQDSFKLPTFIGEKFVSNFHSKATTVMAATETMQKRLMQMGIPEEKLAIRSHGVDIDFFRPRSETEILPEVHEIFQKGEAPYSLFVGRVSPEKNIQAFLDADVEGTKIIVGDGPLLKEFLEAQKSGEYQNVVFAGRQGGEKLAQIYSEADVFVFPSKSDTFGLVQLEAMASGTPVAAFPVQGPIDIITPEVGAMNDNLAIAIKEALTKDPATVRSYAEGYSWRQTAYQFLEHIVEIPESSLRNLKNKIPMYQIVPIAAAGGGAMYAIIYYLQNRD